MTLTADQARQIRTGHDAYVRQVSRMTKAALADLERRELAAQGIERVYGGPASKDELVNAIVSMRYPLATLNEAIHVLYHNPGETWSACEWCHPHQGEHCDCPIGRTA